MKILALGDVVGPASTEYLRRRLGAYREANGIDAVLVNGENANSQNGISRADAQDLLSAGADVITTGNHVWKWNDLRTLLDEEPRIIRPANYPGVCPGTGSALLDVNGRTLLCVNVAGTAYGEPLGDPFDAVERVLRENEGKYDFAALDVHAEATGEKAAIARYFDGRIAVVYGTHTHVQTADARILPRGSGFITDLGMVGPDDSILGVKPESVIERLRTHMPVRFETAAGNITAHGAVFTLDRDLRVTAVEAISF